MEKVVSVGTEEGVISKMNVPVCERCGVLVENVYDYGGEFLCEDCIKELEDDETLYNSSDYENENFEFVS